MYYVYISHFLGWGEGALLRAAEVTVLPFFLNCPVSGQQMYEKRDGLVCRAPRLTFQLEASLADSMAMACGAEANAQGRAAGFQITQDVTGGRYCYLCDVIEMAETGGKKIWVRDDVTCKIFKE